jgi:hypothetical protein
VHVVVGEGEFIWGPVNEQRRAIELEAYARVSEDEVGVADHGEHSETIVGCELQISRSGLMMDPSRYVRPTNPNSDLRNER